MTKVANKTANFKERVVYEIASGIFRVGDRLPSHRTLCHKYGISRTTVKAGLQALQAEGWLRSEARSGNFVAEYAADLIGRTQAKVQNTEVVFLMPHEQARNPLLQTIFHTFYQNAVNVSCSIAFVNFSALNELATLKGDCAIVFKCLDRRGLFQIRKTFRRVIILNAEDEEFEFITPDNYRGGQMIANYLLEEGYTQIGCIRYREGNISTDFAQRFWGLCRRFDEVHGEIATAFIPMTDYEDVIVPCRQAMEQLQRQIPDLRMTVCLSDMAAVGVYAYCNTNGISIPAEMGVVGFDDQFFTPFINPRLTTLHYPAEAIGILLAEKIAMKEEIIREKVLPVLVKRESVVHA